MARKLLSKRLDEIEPNLTNLFQHSEILILYDQSTDVHTEDKLRTLPINLVVQAAKKSNKKVHIIQGNQIENLQTRNIQSFVNYIYMIRRFRCN